MWSTRSPFANGWDVQTISSSSLLLWHTEDVTKKSQLAVPNQVNQRHSVSHGIDSGVQNIVNALYIRHDSVAFGSKMLILFSISWDITHDSQPYSSIVTQVVLNNLTFVAMGMCRLSQSCSSFQNAHQASDFCLLRSLELDATMEPRYLKSDTWLIEPP